MENEQSQILMAHQKGTNICITGVLKKTYRDRPSYKKKASIFNYMCLENSFHKKGGKWGEDKVKVTSPVH